MRTRKIEFKEILNKDNARILITGDSISYNRYDYDELPRTNGDAFSYGAGMGSWSFSLRDKIYFSDTQFKFGSDIDFNCETVLGLYNQCEIPNTEVFGGKIKTLLPKKDVEFQVNIKSDRVVLYFQQRLDFPCEFDIYIDDVLAVKDYSNKGDKGYFVGYALVTCAIACDNTLERHTVKFSNIRGEAPKITVAGVGAKNISVVLNGRGCQCVSFFLENFEERIANHSPDAVIITVGANDRANITAKEYEYNLRMLFNEILKQNANTKILLLLPTNSHNPNDINCNESPFISLKRAEEFNLAGERVCKELSEKFEVEAFRISSLFDDENVNDWRFDNVHLNKNGNEILLNALIEKFEL